MQSVQTMILELSQISTVQCWRKKTKADFMFTLMDYRQATVGNILFFILSPVLAAQFGLNMQRPVTAAQHPTFLNVKKYI